MQYTIKQYSTLSNHVSNLYQYLYIVRTCMHKGHFWTLCAKQIPGIAVISEIDSRSNDCGFEYNSAQEILILYFSLASRSSQLD